MTLPVGDAHANSWLNNPWSHGGHACDRCHRVIQHEDLLVSIEGNLARVHGYQCSCGMSKGHGKKFDWRLI
jgi:uncharacterized Zn-binding protein involved in type VI secretion